MRIFGKLRCDPTSQRFGRRGETVDPGGGADGVISR